MGFLRILCNQKVIPISPLPKLNKDQKHTIKIIIDYLAVEKSSLRD